MINRRNFLKKTSLTGMAAVTATGLLQARPAEATTDRSLPQGEADDFVLDELDIDALQEKMKKGELSARAITELYLQRIAAIDQEGPALKAVIEINPDALSIADAMDKERKAGKLRGPLHGIPVLIKDNIDTADNMLTTAGSLALLGNKAAKDAFVVKKLREAGVVLLGKTNLSEWANFRSTRSSSGWSSRGGQTKNPYVLDRNPCGSSSGSGAAVAANLCAVAVGTETDGSITAPASFNGVVGLKPTIGLVSRAGIIPISSTQDTAGPMTRTVKDAAILLGVLAGADTNDTSTTINKNVVKDYTRLLSTATLQGKRIGVEKSFFHGHEAVVAVYRQTIELLKTKGAIIEEVDLLEKTNPLGDAEFNLMQYEFKDGLNKYLAKANGKVKSLKELIAYNRQHEKELMPFFKQELLEMSEKKGGLDSKEYKYAVQATGKAKNIIDNLLKEKRLDAIAGVTIGPAHRTDLIYGDANTGFYFCPPAAMAGYPHITVPMGMVNGLPVGLSLMASAFEEEKLLALAHAFEQVSKSRKAPLFLQGVE